MSKGRAAPAIAALTNSGTSTGGLSVRARIDWSGMTLLGPVDGTAWLLIACSQPW
jgi:hypothetical protein